MELLPECSKKLNSLEDRQYLQSASSSFCPSSDSPYFAQKSSNLMNRSRCSLDWHGKAGLLWNYLQMEHYALLGIVQLGSCGVVGQQLALGGIHSLAGLLPDGQYPTPSKSFSNLKHASRGVVSYHFLVLIISSFQLFQLLLMFVQVKVFQIAHSSAVLHKWVCTDWTVVYFVECIVMFLQIFPSL